MTKANVRITRGVIAIVAAVIVWVLIRASIAEPWPNLRWAYVAAAAVGVWGVFDLVRGLLDRAGAPTVPEQLGS